MAEVLDVGLQPEKVYSKQFLKTFANSSFKQEDTSVLEWVVSEVVKVRLRKNYYVRQPSVLLFALGNADLLDTANTGHVALAHDYPPSKPA